jgi:hypothetical protein
MEIMIDFILYSVYALHYVELSLHLWNKTSSTMLYDLLMCCWIWFASTLLKNLATDDQEN